MKFQLMHSRYESFLESARGVRAEEVERSEDKAKDGLADKTIRY